MKNIIILCWLSVVWSKENWSWGSDTANIAPTEAKFQEQHANTAITSKTGKSIPLTPASSTNRQSRKISDGVKPAKGEARFWGMKHKLCKHGLGINCHKGGGVEYIEISQPEVHYPPPPAPAPLLPPQPHYGQGINPNHVFHVQPVALQAVGTPIQAVPLGYGPPGAFNGHPAPAPTYHQHSPAFQHHLTYPSHQPTPPVYAPQVPYAEIDFSEPETLVYEEDPHEKEPPIIKHYHTHIHKSEGSDYVYGGNTLYGSRPIRSHGAQTFGNIYDYYKDDCDCVPVHFCAARDIIGRSDRQPLIDARNNPTSVVSMVQEAKVITPENRLPRNPEPASKKRSRRETESFADTSQRTLGSRITHNRFEGTDRFGKCRQGEVCCRRDGFSGRRLSKTCGQKERTEIVGRVRTTNFEEGVTHFGEHPWQVAILKQEVSELIYVCGATLISDKHILTAAHCVNGVHSNELTVRLGEWDVNRKTEYYSDMETKVDKITVHPSFYSGTMENDIAVVTLRDRVSIDKHPHITPACLPDRYDDFTNQHCEVTGWGKDAFGSSGKFQHILKEVKVPVWGHAGCESSLKNTRLGRDYKLHKGMLCAGGEEGKDACEGDGGSPLVCTGKDGSMHLAGIVSWGLGCGRRGIPGIYVNVAFYYEWISKNIR